MCGKCCSEVPNGCNRTRHKYIGKEILYPVDQNQFSKLSLDVEDLLQWKKGYVRSQSEVFALKEQVQELRSKESKFVKKIFELKEEFNTVVKMVSALETEVKSLRSFTIESVVPDAVHSSVVDNVQDDGAMVLTPLLEELKLLNRNI